MEIKKMRNKILAVAGACFLCAAANADGRTIYTISNSPDGNVVAVVKRDDHGGLKLKGTYPTGGVGTGVGLVIPPDPLGTQNALVLSDDQRWLFVPSAASNQISVFRVYEDTLVLASVTPSGGDYPAGIAVRGNIVYVLHATNKPSITGFRLTGNGRLVPIPGSKRTLSTVTASAGPQPDVLDSPGQIQFSPDGRWLVATDKNVTLAQPGTIELFAVGKDGRLGASSVTTVSTDPAPFGFTFDARGHLLVTEAINGALSSYQINQDGTLTSLSRVVSGQQTVCWIDSRGRYAYTSNTLSDSLSAYRVDDNGVLTVLNPDGLAVAIGAGALPIEVKISGDGKYLYAVAAGLGTIESYRINSHTGGLTKAGELHLYPGLSGMSSLAVE